MTRKQIEEWQRDDAERLRVLFEKRARLSQEAFGDEYGIGNQSAVWQYLNGRIPLNLTVAIKFARGLGCTVSDFSSTLADELGAMDQQAVALGEIIESLPPTERRELLAYLEFKIEKAAGITPERAAHFIRIIDRMRDTVAAGAPPAAPSNPLN